MCRKGEKSAGFLRPKRDEKNPARTSAIPKAKNTKMNVIAEFVQFMCWDKWLLLLGRYGYFHASAARSKCTCVGIVIGDRSTV